MDEKKIVVAFTIGEKVSIGNGIAAKVEGVFIDEHGATYRCAWFDNNQQRQSEYIPLDEIKVC